MTDLILTNFNLHASRIPHQTEGMQVVTLPNCLYVDSGIPHDTFNIICILNGAEITREELSEALRCYQRKDHPFCIWITEEQLTENMQSIFASFSIFRRSIVPEQGMIFDLENFVPVKNELHQHIRIVASPDALKSFSGVLAGLTTPPDQHVITYYNRVAEKILAPENGIVLMVCYADGIPVGTVELFPSDEDTAGIYGLVTLPGHRGHGIATALMTFALNHAKTSGFKNVVLQATKDGAGLYQRLGFQPVTLFYEYA